LIIVHRQHKNPGIRNHPDQPLHPRHARAARNRKIQCDHIRQHHGGKVNGLQKSPRLTHDGQVRLNTDQQLYFAPQQGVVINCQYFSAAHDRLISNSLARFPASPAAGRAPACVVAGSTGNRTKTLVPTPLAE